MELRHLRYFIAVAEEENVTKAAARLRISQPPLSRQIRDLEEELGVALFERTAKTVRLTPAGVVFLKEARAVMVRAEAAVKAVRAVAGGLEGELNIAYAPTLTIEIFPEALRWFQEVSPEVRVHLHDLNSEEMLDGIHSGRLDLALLATPSSKRMKGLHFERLREVEIQVAVPLNHRFCGLTDVPLKELKRERLIGYSRRGYPEYHEDLARGFAGNEKGQLKSSPIQEEHDSVSSLITAVESGRGVALVASCVKALVGARLELRPISPPLDPIVVGALWRSRKLTEAANRFVEGLRRGVIRNQTE
ncbi:MAG: LysR family transcriptional regulator [Verrucomicrobiota bacterium]